MKYSALSDGRHLSYRETGSGQPLVLLHGWSMSSAVFQEVMVGLSASFRVLAPDLAGHGHSDITATELTLGSLAGDIEEWLESLELDSIFVLGWSLGGQVALELAQRQQLRIEKMILVATTPLFIATEDWGYGLPAAQLRAMDRQLQRDYRGSMGEFFKLMFSGEEIGLERYRQIVRFAVRDGSLPKCEISRGGLQVLATTDLRPQLGQLGLPVLVHFGLLDQITLPSAGRFLAETIPGAEAVSWPGVGHAPFLSRPEDSVSLWLEFLH